MTLEVNVPTPTHECKYCKRKFAKETSLAVHVCEQKKRQLSQGEPGPRIGYRAYQKFFEMTQSGKPKTFEEFAKSPYYLAFVKFGWFCVEVDPINMVRFIEYVIKQNKKLDKWASNSLYDEFLKHWLPHEAVDDALERAVLYATEWGQKHAAPFSDVLRHGSSGSLVIAIARGRISPWIIYSCESSDQMLSKMSTEQRALIWPTIDPGLWIPKLASQKSDWDHAKAVLRSAGW